MVLFDKVVDDVLLYVMDWFLCGLLWLHNHGVVVTATGCYIVEEMVVVLFWGFYILDGVCVYAVLELFHC